MSCSEVAEERFPGILSHSFAQHGGAHPCQGGHGVLDDGKPRHQKGHPEGEYSDIGLEAMEAWKDIKGIPDQRQLIVLSGEATLSAKKESERMDNASKMAITSISKKTRRIFRRIKAGIIL